MANTARIATRADTWGDVFGYDATPTGNETSGPYNDGGVNDPIRMMEIDNTANTSANAYLRVYNVHDASPGSDKPQIIIKAPAGKKITVSVTSSSAVGLTLTGGVYATTNQTGGFDGTASPASSTPIRFITG